MEASSHGWGDGDLEFRVENGEKRAESHTKNPSPHQWSSESLLRNPVHLDPGQGQMTVRQSWSLAFGRCFHFDLILILIKISSSTTKKITEASGITQEPIPGLLS